MSKISNKNQYIIDEYLVKPIGEITEADTISLLKSRSSGIRKIALLKEGVKIHSDEIFKLAFKDKNDTVRRLAIARRVPPMSDEQFTSALKDPSVDVRIEALFHKATKLDIPDEYIAHILLEGQSSNFQKIITASDYDSFISRLLRDPIDIAMSRRLVEFILDQSSLIGYSVYSFNGSNIIARSLGHENFRIRSKDFVDVCHIWAKVCVFSKFSVLKNLVDIPTVDQEKIIISTLSDSFNSTTELLRSAAAKWQLDRAEKEAETLLADAFQGKTPIKSIKKSV
jgi:hypothetical protein